ncbi:MAG: AMP-binding protein, partial [Oligoflexia bacterium]|nr:AMP-binding protein [Oligoflexia bacterium]MBF0366991.1 AMP-binding protein [Oligoflexia bacterium]
MLAELEKYYPFPNNLVELFQQSAGKWPDRPAIGQKDPKTKQYQWTSYQQLSKRIDNLRGGLRKLQLAKGEAVGVILSNSTEWFMIENASHGLGLRFVPMYERELAKKWQYIIQDAQIKVLFVRDQLIYEKVSSIIGECPSLVGIYLVSGEGEKTLSSLEKWGQDHPTPAYKPHWSEIAVLIYTSGTTGSPKGVLLTHGNLTACSRTGYKLFPELNEHTVALSILPWAHSYALSAELHNCLQFGASIGIMESTDTLANDFLAIRPTALMCVPRVFNKIYNGINKTMQDAPKIKKWLFDLACAEAKKCRGRKPTLTLKFLDQVVFKKIRSRFGGRLRTALTASAVMNNEIALFFKDIGIHIYDCYGLTETAPAITMNAPIWGNKIGSVGKPISGMHVKIEQGEIIAYGAHVMVGYHNKPEQTAAIMTTDTWNGFRGIKTGDLGHFDQDGFLYVTGRCKDEYKLACGKYVHPETIETEIKLLPYVINAFVTGDNQEYNVAALVLDRDTLNRDIRTKEWQSLPTAELFKKAAFIQFITTEVTNHLKNSFAFYEIPRQYLLLDEDFSIDNGMLTQTMKVVRGEIIKKYGVMLSGLYGT